MISSWIEYCSSCAKQMKILQTAKKEGELSDIKFDNIEYFSFDVMNRDIADAFNVLYQTTVNFQGWQRSLQKHRRNYRRFNL